MYYIYIYIHTYTTNKQNGGAAVRLGALQAGAHTGPPGQHRAGLNLSLFLSLHIYIYIYTHVIVKVPDLETLPASSK